MSEVSLSSPYKDLDLAHGVEAVVVPDQWAESGSTIYVEGSGIKVRDINGKEYLDASSCGLCSVVGYGNREVADAAWDQMMKLHNSRSFGGVANIPKIKLASKLAQVSPGLQRFIFENSGSDAVESTFKIARFYWRQKGLDKYKIIHRDRSYHGSTLATMSACNPGLDNSDFAPFAPGFVSIPTPYCYRCPLDESYPSCEIACAQALEQAIETEGEDTVAAFIGEGVVGSEGFIPPPPEYWPKVRAICTKHNVLMIMDEVITGFGKTGKFWAYQHWNVIPDLMTSSKGISSGYVPMSAVGITENVYRGMTEKNKPFPHLHTFTGHPVACAISLKVIEIMERENLVERAATLGAYVKDRLMALKEKSPYVGDVRVLGLMQGIELVADKDSKKRFDPEKQIGIRVSRLAREKGVLYGSVGDDIMLMCPTPTTTMDEMDQILDVVEWSIMQIDRILSSGDIE
jgi:adenosylmethionine-8-amino-7-oxononanoate aminotransferase